MGTAGQSTYQFGAFRLDPPGRELLHGEQRMDLPPRAFDTLVLLVRENGKLVEKDRLMRTVWPDTVVEENNLSQAIYLLRKVLHDGENGIRYIETVPKQGYRFVARVREIETWDDDSDAPVDAARSALQDSVTSGEQDLLDAPSAPSIVAEPGIAAPPAAPPRRSHAAISRSRLRVLSSSWLAHCY